MDKNMPKEYVAELLKQLEELKRKKARKERKLQKLKSCSLKDVKKEKFEKASHASDQRVLDKISVAETSLKKLEENVPEKSTSERKSSGLFNEIAHAKSSDTYFKNDQELLVNEKCHSSSLENNKFNKNFKNHANIDVQESIILADRESIKMSDSDKIAIDCLKKCSYLIDTMKHDGSISSENDKSVKLDFDEQKTNYKKLQNSNLSLLSNKLNYDKIETPTAFKNAKIEFSEQGLSVSNDEVIYSPDKASSSTTDKPRTGKIVIHDEPSNDTKEDVELIHNDLMLPSIKDNVKNFTNPKSSENENKLSNDSNKSITGSKEKSSDILDDSLNSNMSFFMSADLFAHEDNNKKDLNKDHNDNELCEKINESLPLIKSDSKLANPKLPSVVLSNLSNQNDFNIFNFPKFSTPTEGNTQVEKYDDEPDLIERSPEISNPNKRNGLVNEALKNSLPLTSKFNSPMVNFVLEKRLSSVLDAHYDSPKKITSKTKISSVITNDNPDYFNMDINNGNAYKKRKLFAEVSCVVPIEPKVEEKCMPSSDKKSNTSLCKFPVTSIEFDQEIRCEDFDNVSAFDSGSSSSTSLKNVPEPHVTFVKNSCDDVPLQVSKTVDGLVNEVCDNTSACTLIIQKHDGKNAEKRFDVDDEPRIDSEILVIPETEGLLDSYFPKDTEDFLEISTLSQSMKDFPVKENLLNVSSQSKLESPVVNNIVAAVKSSRSLRSTHLEDNVELDIKTDDNVNLKKIPEEVTSDTALAFDNSLGLDTSFLEDDTQDLGNFKQVPYMDDINAGEKMTDQNKTGEESNLKFLCSLSSSVNDPVMDVEVILFHHVKYAVLQHKTYLCVWRQEEKKQWIKIFNHQIEDMLSLVKISVSMDDDNLVIIMLLSNEEQYCLQFLIFERDARVIKLMENTHWLEERCSEDSILLCGLSGLMFAIAQNKENAEVSVHAFISLKESPKLMTAVLGSTDTPLYSLCKIDKLPNALMGINDSMLYVWHILEARLVTAVTLHPHDYIPIKECFWATVENGLIYFLTTCVEDKSHHICQLLAANLATGFCQSAMKYSTLPSDNKVQRIIKATYQEPFLVVAHSEGAFIWSVTEEFCCAALPSTSDITSISISRDFDNWGLLAVGSKNGLINCYSLH